MRLDGSGACATALPASGGPDVLRGIYPVVASITAAGFERFDDQRVADRTTALLDTLIGNQIGGHPSS